MKILKFNIKDLWVNDIERRYYDVCLTMSLGAGLGS
jgi:hypothetical protein